MGWPAPLVEAVNGVFVVDGDRPCAVDPGRKCMPAAWVAGLPGLNRGFTRKTRPLFLGLEQSGRSRSPQPWVPGRLNSDESGSSSRLQHLTAGR